MSKCPCGHSWSGSDCGPPGGTDTDDGPFEPQEGAQTAQERIAAVLEAHEGDTLWESRDIQCECDARWRTPREHRTHLAAAVVDSLLEAGVQL